MFILYVFILIVYLSVHTDSQDLEVIASGVVKLKLNDMVMSFYLSIQHHGAEPRRVMGTMLECCEEISDGEQDCDQIDLYGGDFGVIQPGSTKNLTMLYPNLYVYNRRGYCLVNIIHRSLGHQDVIEIKHRVDFDTRLSADFVPTVLEGWYDPQTIVLCETLDLDPLDHCNPVNCYLKYSGYRNYYNHKMKLCQRVPICRTDLTKELPDIVYIPTNNVCRNLDKGLTREDIAKLVHFHEKSESQKVDIRCHHGVVDPRSGLCICDYGWKSEPFDPEAYVPGKTIYSMCTIKCQGPNDYTHLPTVIGLILALWLMIFVFCCEKNGLFLAKASCTEISAQVVYYPLRESSNMNCGVESIDIRSTNGSYAKSQTTYVAHVESEAQNKLSSKKKKGGLFFFN